MNYGFLKLYDYKNNCIYQTPLTTEVKGTSYLQVPCFSDKKLFPVYPMPIHPFLPSSLPLRYIVYQFDDKVENVTIQHAPVPVTQLKQPILIMQPIMELPFALEGFDKDHGLYETFAYGHTKYDLLPVPVTQLKQPILIMQPIMELPFALEGFDKDHGLYETFAYGHTKYDLFPLGKQLTNIQTISDKYRSTAGDPYDYFVITKQDTNTVMVIFTQDEDPLCF